jgi:hypothetical protein
MGKGRTGKDMASMTLVQFLTDWYAGIPKAFTSSNNNDAPRRENIGHCGADT